MSAKKMPTRARNNKSSLYKFDSNFNKTELTALIHEFTDAIYRRIDRSLANNLKKELLEASSTEISDDTLKQLSRWCKTDGALYSGGMEVARKISILLFGCIVDREQLGT